MKRRGWLLGLLCILLVAPCAWGKVVGREVIYHAGDTRLKGYLVRDTASKEPRPAILVVHEWWGLNDYARKRAQMLAKLGYVALAVDMYGGGKIARHPDDAGKFAAAVTKNLEIESARFNAALAYLKEEPGVDPQRIAAIGYCFGGGVVLQMARQGAELKGVASFHGPLATDRPAQPGAVKAKILVLTGEADQMVPAEQVVAFKGEMSKAGASFRVISYPGAMHSFTNPDADRLARKFKLPIAYSPQADRDSWAQLQDFLDDLFAPPAT